MFSNIFRRNNINKECGHCLCVVRPLELNVQLIINTMLDRSFGLLGRKMSSTTSYLQHQHQQCAHDGPMQAVQGGIPWIIIIIQPSPPPPVTRDQADPWYSRDIANVHMILGLGRAQQGIPYVVIQKFSYSLQACLQYNHNTYRDRIAVPGRMHIPIFFHIHTYLLSVHVTVPPYNHIKKWMIPTKNKYTRFISCRDHTKTW